MADERHGAVRRQQRAAGRDHVHGVDDALPGLALRQEAADPGLDRLEHFTVVVDGGEREHPRGLRQAADRRDGGQA